MDATVDQIIDVNATNFEEAVLKASQERVVIVDFWAPWCGPCKTLTPVLEEVVGEMGSGVILAKVNVDENQELAGAFRVQSIPTVMIIKDGRPVDGFTGALPKEQILERLQPLVPEMPEAEATDAEDLLAQAQGLLEQGDWRRATLAFEQHLTEKPEDAQALVGLGRMRLMAGDFDAVRELVPKVEQGTAEYDQAQALLTQIQLHQLCAEAGGRAVCAQKLPADPDDLEAVYLLGCCAAAEGDFAVALEQWLKIVERQRDFRDGAAKDAMVSVFHLLGRHNEVVADYPQRLYRTLY
jgi:putative thioredoxin